MLRAEGTAGGFISTGAVRLSLLLAPPFSVSFRPDQPYLFSKCCSMFSNVLFFQLFVFVWFPFVPLFSICFIFVYFVVPCMFPMCVFQLFVVCHLFFQLLCHLFSNFFRSLKKSEEVCSSGCPSFCSGSPKKSEKVCSYFFSICHCVLEV